MSAGDDRLRVRDKYRTILGRNKYSQAKRSYVFKKASDGNYYSDCSSSVTACYRECGFPVTYGGSKLPNTVGIYNSKDVTEVKVKINAKGEITNTDLLRIGDMLLFAGTDKSRSASGYVGHVEMVGEIASSGKITLYGHGSGTPRKTEMQAYLRKRRKQTASTALGHRGLIKVVRKIQDDANSAIEPNPVVTATPVGGPCVVISNCEACNIRSGPGKEYEIVGDVKPGTILTAPETEGWVAVIFKGKLCWVSAKYAGRAAKEEG